MQAIDEEVLSTIGLPLRSEGEERGSTEKGFENWCRQELGRRNLGSPDHFNVHYFPGSKEAAQEFFLPTAHIVTDIWPDSSAGGRVV